MKINNDFIFININYTHTIMHTQGHTILKKNIQENRSLAQVNRPLGFQDDVL